MMSELQKVSRAAKKVASARQELESAIRAASKEASLREIAKAASVSHEQVRRLIA